MAYELISAMKAEKAKILIERFGRRKVVSRWKSTEDFLRAVRWSSKSAFGEKHSGQNKHRNKGARPIRNPMRRGQPRGGLLPG